MNEAKQRYHPLTFVVFLVAVFTLLTPLQADLVFVMLLKRQIMDVLATIVINLLIVVALLIYAQTQTKKHPEKWKPRLLTKLTWGIVILNIVFNLILFMNLKTEKTNGPNQRIEVAR